MYAVYRNRIKTQKGFTLIEMLLAILIFGIVSTSLYLSMRSGLELYKRSDEGLREAHEITFFLNSLERELKNSFYSSQNPFIGKGGYMKFPAVKKIYSKDSQSIELVFLSYSVKSKHVLKTTEFLSRKKEPIKDKDILRPYLKKMAFSYGLYDAEEKSVEWNDEWDSEDYEALPRAVHVAFTVGFQTKDGDEYDERKLERILFIPDGVWGSEDV